MFIINKILSKTIRNYNTTMSVLEYNPLKFVITLAEGKLGVKEQLTDIKHNWYSSNEYALVAGENCQFFGTYTQGMEYVDSGYLMNNGSINDQFLELIFENNKLILDDIVGSEIKTKYPNTKWAGGVGFGLVENGVIKNRKSELFYHFTQKHPRSAIGQKANGNIVQLVCDGRNTGSSGLTGKELSTVMLELGCVTAVSLDGGGSSTMTLNKNDGQGYKVINKLYNNYQRYITSSLLVYSKEEYQVVDSFASKPVEEDIGYRMVLYSHLKSISAVEGEMVHCENPWSPASIIGVIGDTGQARGIHLHICVIKGKRDNLWILLDMTKDVIPDREELNWFTDDTLFDYPIVVTGDWLSYLNHFAKDVVPEDRKRTTKHYEIKWNRSFSGRVLKTGYNEFHGNYVLVWYDILPV